MTDATGHDAATDGADASRNAEVLYGIPPTGYRLPADTRIGRVRLQVSDLNRSLAYYEGVLGFRVLHQTDGRANLGPYGEDTPLIELH